MSSDPHPASFRDPSGFVFERDGILMRAVNTVYREDFDCFASSGLARKLIEAGHLIPHREVEDDPLMESDGVYKVLLPERVPFISYPYEWCFGQLKDAALLTLRIQRMALDHGMSLKDASAHNIQFVKGKPLLIDSLSLERVPEGRPWIAYRQFCRHFLGPLALMAARDPRLVRLLQAFPDGLPLDLVSNLLPARSRLNLGLGLHIHAHARLDRRYRSREPGRPIMNRPMPLKNLRALVDHLEGTIRRLRGAEPKTRWSDYDAGQSYAPEALARKTSWVRTQLSSLQPGLLWDLGANTGAFGRIGAELGFAAIAFDEDPIAVEQSYREVKARADERLLPLILDLMSPSPGTGWANAERSTFQARGPARVVLALALVHHLAIGENVPLGKIADFLGGCGRHLLVEFVPKEDPQVAGMLALRRDIFPDYCRDGFERAFGRHFRILEREELRASGRILYAMEARARQ